MLGLDADDDAVDQTATADEDEGGFDPLAVLEVLDTPEDEYEFSDEDDDGVSADADGEEVDYRAALAERDAELARVREESQVTRDEADRKEQLRLMREAKAAWDAEEAQVLDWAKKQPNQANALQQVQAFYNKKLSDVTNMSQQIIQQAYAGQYIDQVASSSGLDADDKALLAAVDPKFAPQLAKALAAKNKKVGDELAAIKAEVKNLTRGRQANRRALTGQDAPSSGRPTGQRAPTIQYGSEENAMFLLDATRALQAQRKR
jgi:hypothetical protein